MLCPICKVNELHPEEVMNPVSRIDNETAICQECAVKQAMEDM